MRPRRKIHVAALVTAPEDVPSRPGVRLIVIGAMVLVLFAVMVLRLWSLQVINHKIYAAAVTSNEVRTVTVPAPRGLIVDRNGTVLVGNQVENELVLSRVEATLHPKIIGKLAALIDKPATTIRADITNQQYSPYQPVPILDPATASVVQYVEAHQSEFPGVSVEQVTQRYYPQGGTTAAQLLGYVGPITPTELKAHPNYSETSEIGKTGIEEEYEKYLHGAHGREKLSVSATGVVEGTLTQKAPSQGDTVQLHITLGLQNDVQQALTQVLAADRNTLHAPATNGAAVVLDAQTGAVLAMASSPGYSLTTWVGGISTAQLAALNSHCTTTTGADACPLDDNAIQGLYTPGSTFKLATATAALQDGLITPSTEIDDTGTFSMKLHTYPTCTGDCTFHDATPADATTYTVSSALTVSDDFFFYNLGVRFYHTSVTVPKYNVNSIQDTANSLGFGALTGIDLPDEVQGVVDGKTERLDEHKETPTAFPNTYWYPATSLEVAFGQGGTQLTPIAEAQAYATFATGGIKYQPEVAADVLTPTGKPVEKIAPKETGHVTYNPTDWTAMLQGFLGVTHTPSGTAYGIFQQYSHVPSTYEIAGKTGTATISTTTKVHPPDAWFVGFGPVDHATNQPEYVVVVAVHEAGYGDQAAAPAVANIFNYLYANPVPSTPTLPTATQQPSTTAPAAKPAAGATTTTTTRTTSASSVTSTAGAAALTAAAAPGGATVTSAESSRTASAVRDGSGRSAVVEGSRATRSSAPRAPP